MRLNRAALSLAPALLAATLLACDASVTAPSTMHNTRPSLSAIAETENVSFPIAVEDFVPCANGGAGEVVALTGNLHFLSHLTIANNGNATLTSHFQPQGVTGVGLATGDTYRGTGVTREVLHFRASGGVVSTSVNNFRLIGPGPHNNLLIHTISHVTVTPDGDVTTVVEKSSIECR